MYKSADAGGPSCRPLPTRWREWRGSEFFWLKTARFAVIFVAAIIEMMVVEEY